MSRVKFMWNPIKGEEEQYLDETYSTQYKTLETCLSDSMSQENEDLLYRHVDYDE